MFTFVPTPHKYEGITSVPQLCQWELVLTVHFVFQSISCVWLFVIPWTAARQTSLFFTMSKSLLKLMSAESVMPSNHLILCCPLLLLPSISPSIRVFSNELTLVIRWPKDWSFSFSFSPSNGYSGLISFRIDWFDLLAVQGTLRSLLQHYSSKASILGLSALFMVQLSHPYSACFPCLSEIWGIPNWIACLTHKGASKTAWASVVPGWP